MMVGLDALYARVLLINLAVAPAMFQQYVAPVANEVDGIAFVFKLLTFVAFAIWIYVAGRNLVRAGYENLEFSPASRIWWFVVPVACLFKPFQGMRELWNASHGNPQYDENNGLVGIWWAIWLLCMLTGAFASLAQGEAGPLGLGLLGISSALYVARAVVAIVMIRRIAAAQARLSQPALAEVFA